MMLGQQNKASQCTPHACGIPRNVQANQAIPQTHTMRSHVQGVTVPVYGSMTPWTSPENFTGVSILWDTGGYGQSTVTSATYGAFTNLVKYGTSKLRGQLSMPQHL
jgi:hypothetical protein